MGAQPGTPNSEPLNLSGHSTPKKDVGACRPLPCLSAVKTYGKLSFNAHRKTFPDHQIDEETYHKNIVVPGWKKLTAEQKDYFQRLARDDKLRYDNEVQQTKAPSSSSSNKSEPTKSSGKRKRAAKDPRAPKRNLSAFFHFCNQERPKVREVNPGATVGEIAKVLGLRWGKCTPAAKAQFEDLAAADRERYKVAKALYETEKSAEPTSSPAPGPTHSEPKGPYHFPEDDEDSDSESSL